MSKKPEELIADLEKQVDDLTKKLETAIEASENVQKAEELSEEVETLKGELAASKEALEQAAAELELAKAKGSMSDKERAYFDGLKDDKMKKDFMTATPDQRLNMMKNFEKNDEVIKIDGTEIRKSEVGAAQFAVIKSQQARIEKAEKDAADERDRRQMSEFGKRADAEFSHLPGETVAKAELLKAVDALPEGVKKTFEEILKAGEAAIKLAFEKLGHNPRKDVAKDGNAFETKVAEIQKSEKLSRTQAMQKARERFPDEFEAYQNAPVN